jgi:hypothetical protein
MRGGEIKMLLLIVCESPAISTADATAILTAVETAGLVVVDAEINSAGKTILKIV